MRKLSMAIKILMLFCFIIFGAELNVKAQCKSESVSNPNQFVPLTPGVSVAQTFTPTCTGQLSSISLKMDVSFFFSGTIFIFSGAVTTFDPFVSINDQGFAAIPSTNGSNIVDINFQNPIVLNAGTPYTFWVVNDGIISFANIYSSDTSNTSGRALLVDNLEGTSEPAQTPVSLHYTVQLTPIALDISGVNNVCAGSNIQLTANQGGGVWSSSNVIARVDNNGVVTGNTAGVATIKYTLGGQSTTKDITVKAVPATPNLFFVSGQNPFVGAPSGNWCRNRNFTVGGSPSGGTFSGTRIIVNPTTGAINTGSSTGAASLSYTVSNLAGCGSSRTFNFGIVACATKGVQSEPINANSFTVYPNPAKDILNIKFDKITVGTIVLTDLYGKQHVTQAISFGNNSVDVSRLVKGIYFLNVITENSREMKKVIVE